MTVTQPDLHAVPDAPEAPDHLSESSRELWEHVTTTWLLSETELALFQGALEAIDTHDVAMEEVRRIGPTITNPKSGNVKMNPALTAAATSLRTFRQAIKALDLEDEFDRRTAAGRAAAYRAAQDRRR